MVPKEELSDSLQTTLSERRPEKTQWEKIKAGNLGPWLKLLKAHPTKAKLYRYIKIRDMCTETRYNCKINF